MSGARPVVLVVCDGWGHREGSAGNAIAAARTPAFDQLFARWPHTLVEASGTAVGLPPGQQGNSEVGHLTIGAGRVVMQALMRISLSIEDGSFFENAALTDAVRRARDHGRTLHCLGLVSPGGVHSTSAHALALARLARREGLDRVQFHVITDGRDVLPTSAADDVATFREGLRTSGVGQIASVAGRWWAMDRDRRWDRTAAAYQTFIGDGVAVAADPVDYIRGCYRDAVTDEFLPPVSIAATASERVRVEDGDSIVFFNFRPDRMRQLCHALLDDGFTEFARSRRVRDLCAVTFTDYDVTLDVDVAFPAEDVRDTLAEVVSRHGLAQFHVAETEKYAHVTYFINGGREQAFPGEDRLLIASPRVATYDATPAMSALAITDAVLQRLDGDCSLIVVNYANADMVGHTGDMAATVRAVEVVDECVGRLAARAEERGAAMLVTADHGNAELVADPVDGSPLTAHTTNPVPVLLCGSEAHALRDGGGLRDIAPTVLRVIGLEPPAAMTGSDLAIR